MRYLMWSLFIVLGSTPMVSCGVEQLPDDDPELSVAMAAVSGDGGTRCLVAADAVVSNNEPPTVIVIAPINSPDLPSPSCDANDDFAYKAVVYIDGDASPASCLTADEVQALKRTNDGVLTADILATLPPAIAAIITCPP